MRSARFLILAMLAALLLSGCEQLFTTNLLSGLERDPSKLSFEGQVNYARQALRSGDASTQAKAYDALAASLASRNNTDPELNSLAATLALGASGLPGILGDLIDVATGDGFNDSASLAAALDAQLGNVNYDYVDAAVDQILATRNNGGTPTESQYVFALVGLVLKAGAEQNGIDNVDADEWDEVDALRALLILDHPESDFIQQFDDLTTDP